MSTTPPLTPAIQEFAAEISRLRRRIEQLERNQIATQLDLTSIEVGGITVNDANGDPQISIGMQDDGTFAQVALAANTPAAPSDPVVQAGITGIYVIWDGLMQDGSQPTADFDRMQIHVAQISGFTPDETSLQGSIDHEGMFGVGSLTPGVPYYVLLVPVNTAQQLGTQSNEVSAMPTAVPDNIPPGGVTGAMIGNGAVTGNNIAAGAIAAVHIAAGTVVAGIIDATVVNAAVFNGSVFNGIDFTLDSFGERYYSDFPAAGSLAASIAPQAYVDPFGNVVPAGFMSQIGGLQAILANANLTLVKASGALAPPGILVQDLTNGNVISLQTNDIGISSDGTNFATFSVGAGAYPQIVSGGGLVQNISGTHKANVSPASITTTGVHDIGSSVNVALLDMEVGAVFEWWASGVASCGTTPTSATFSLQVGGTAVASLAIPTADINAGLAGFGFFVRARMSIINAGSSGQISTLMEVGWHSASGVAGCKEYFLVTGATPALGTLRNMGLQFQWGTVPGITALNPDIQTFGRLA